MKNCWLHAENEKEILLAPNAFKGSLDADEFCRILSEEFQNTGFRIRSFPLCDGGDGSAAILASYFKAQAVEVATCDALGRPFTAVYYVSGNTALLDVAGICGLKGLIPAEYDVLNANTAGLGTAVCDARRRGCCHMILGLGGSASIDGGTGALEEMGLEIVNFSSSFRNHLIDIKDISCGHLKEQFKDISFLLLCDVDNLLYGPQGAAYIFGPQKGASPDQITLLEQELIRYAGLICSLSGKDMNGFLHGGAAGGIAAAFAALLNARLVSGARYCLEYSGFKRYLSQAALVITGEGKLDNQTLCGKLPGVVASLCREKNVPVLAITGLSDLHTSPFEKVYQLVDYAANLPDSMRQPGYYLRQAAKDIKKNYLNSL